MAKQAWKLPSKNVVVTENGVTKVLTPPKGVSYSENANRWYASVLSDDSTHGNPIWRSRSWGCEKHGVIAAFEMAVAERKNSLSFLLNRRMLPRILRDYTILERNGLYVVRDPIEKTYRAFSTQEHAKAFNQSVTKDWILKYTFDTGTMIQLSRDNGEYVSFSGGAPTPYVHTASLSMH